VNSKTKKKKNPFQLRKRSSRRFGTLELGDSYDCVILTLYGLPQTTPKQSKKVRAGLDANYAYLAGNAFGKDKKGRPKKDDSSISADMQAAGQGGDSADYSAYVCYELGLE
jgi:hypothetical protein